MTDVAKFLLKTAVAVFLFSLSVFTVACTRKASPQSQVNIKAPTRSDLAKLTPNASILLWEGKKICFAINVTGDGISQTGVCGQNIGLTAGFAEEGQNITITVNRGSRRQFALWGTLTDANGSCPSIDDLQNNPGVYATTYSAGVASDITLDSEEKIVEIPVAMESNPLGASSGITECGDQPGIIRAALLSSGLIVNEKLNLISNDNSSPIWESLTFGLGVSGNEWTYVSNSQAVAVRPESNVVAAFSNLSVPPFVRSVTQRPGTRDFFGLYENGQIVSINSSTGAVTEPQACPLETCKVPVWMQSISIGNNQRVFGLDHAGNIYQVKSGQAGPETTFIRSVSPIVSQLVFY